MSLASKIITGIILGFLALSTFGIYYFNQMPSELSRYVPNCRYRQEADFTCMVMIKPSILYENRTFLTPDETIYSSLAEQANILLQYRFTCDQPVRDLQLRYSVDGALQAEGGWRKNFTLTQEKTINQSDISEEYVLNISSINQLIERIEKETEAPSAKYTYNIVPHIMIEASTDEGPISEKLEPSMSITFSGRRIEFTGLKHSSTGSLGHYEKFEALWSLLGFTLTVRNMQYASYIATASFSTCLCGLAWWTMKRPPLPAIEKIRKKYGEKIVESSEPAEGARGVTVKVKSIEDLNKLSEQTIKPIIHEESILEKEGSRVKHHALYVLDADVRYELTFEEGLNEK